MYTFTAETIATLQQFLVTESGAIKMNKLQLTKTPTRATALTKLECYIVFQRTQAYGLRFRPRVSSSMARARSQKVSDAGWMRFRSAVIFTCPKTRHSSALKSGLQDNDMLSMYCL